MKEPQLVKLPLQRNMVPFNLPTVGAGCVGTRQHWHITIKCLENQRKIYGCYFLYWLATYLCLPVWIFAISAHPTHQVSNWNKQATNVLQKLFEHAWLLKCINVWYKHLQHMCMCKLTLHLNNFVLHINAFYSLSISHFHNYQRWCRWTSKRACSHFPMSLCGSCKACVPGMWIQKKRGLIVWCDWLHSAAQWCPDMMAGPNLALVGFKLASP